METSRVTTFILLALAAPALASRADAQTTPCTTITLTGSSNPLPSDGTLNALAFVYERAGGPGAVQVAVSPPGCTYSVSSPDAWLTPGVSSAAGDGVVTFTLAPLSTPDERTAHLQIGNQTLWITQRHAAVSSQLSSPAGGATIRMPALLSGWAFYEAVPSGTGIDYVDIYAVDERTPPAGGCCFPRIYLGRATYGLARAAVADVFGSRYLNSGFQFPLTSLAPGRYRIEAYAYATGVTYPFFINSSEVTVAEPVLSVSAAELRYVALRPAAAVTATTGAQALDVRGTGGLAWTVSADQPWVVLSRTSGTADGRVLVSIDQSAVPAGNTATATIRVDATGAAGSPMEVTVRLDVVAQSAWPFGFLDTPADGAANLSGAVAVTGWALDDIGVSHVRLYRDPAAGETGIVFLAEAALIEGARPDVATAYPDYPLKTRGGWGVMVLTNMLPGQGNGAYRIHAYAEDAEGHTTLLGSRTFTASNASSTLPFGTIDTPPQGGTVSGIYTMFGWALSPQPAAIVADVHTVTMYIDGQPAGPARYGAARADIASLFPGYNNSSGAIAYYTFDTRDYSNGLHTVMVSVRDNFGRSTTIGSRYFVIDNP